jgi:hypothetical protein
MITDRKREATIRRAAYTLFNRQRVIHACQALSSGAVLAGPRRIQNIPRFSEELATEARAVPRYIGYAGLIEFQYPNLYESTSLSLQFDSIRQNVPNQTVAQHIIDALAQQGLVGTWSEEQKSTIHVDLAQRVQTQAPRLIAPTPLKIPQAPHGPHSTPFSSLPNDPEWGRLPASIRERIMGLDQFDDRRRVLEQVRVLEHDTRHHSWAQRAPLIALLASLEHRAGLERQAHDRMDDLYDEILNAYGTDHHYVLYAALQQAVFILSNCHNPKGYEHYRRALDAIPPTHPLTREFYTMSMEVIAYGDPWNGWWGADVAHELLFMQRTHCQTDHCICVADILMTYSICRQMQGQYLEIMEDLCVALGQHLTTLGPEAKNTRSIYSALVTVLLAQHRDAEALSLLQSSTAPGPTLSDESPTPLEFPRWTKDRLLIEHDLPSYRAQVIELTIYQMLWKADIALRLGEHEIADIALSQAKQLIGQHCPTSTFAVTAAFLEAEYCAMTGEPHATIHAYLDHGVYLFQHHYSHLKNNPRSARLRHDLGRMLEEYGTPTIKSRYRTAMGRLTNKSGVFHPDDRSHLRYDIIDFFMDE